MFNSNSYNFKRLYLAEKARSKFRTRPSGVRRGGGGSVRIPCIDPEILFSRYSLKFLVAHFSLKAMYV